jgi:hypothetical protein
MNTQKSIIFAGVIGVLLGISTGSSFAAKATYTSADLLIKGTNQEFTAYVKEEFPKFASKEGWKSIEQFVTVYNESASKLTDVAPAQKEGFEKAVRQLNKKLSRRSVEAKQWATRLEATSKQIRFISNFDLDSLTPVIEEVSVPSSLFKNTTPSTL